MTSASSKKSTKRQPTGRMVRNIKKTPRERVSSFTTTTSAYADQLYTEVVEDSVLDEFLEGTDCYDAIHKMWFNTDGTPAGDLTDRIFKILSSIVRRFAQSADTSVKRDVVNTRHILSRDVKNEDGYPAYPALFVQATGPSFEQPQPSYPSLATDSPLPQLGFSNMATYFSVKPASEHRNVRKYLNEMASYAGRIFHAQPNRLHVRCLLFAGRYLRLIHFDRAGVQVTPPIDIHQNPHTLVRLVVGLSSKNERVLGLDDSIQWSIVDGRKQQGTITTTGPTGETKTYPIVDRIPVPQETICGRATTCWRVQDPETLEEYVIKDSWRPDDVSPEHKLLELVKGIPGVVQMVSYELCRPETNEFRCPSTAGGYRNRTATRITTRSYGRAIEFFNSVLQFLRALRDAIAGHQRLVGDDIRILHRDVSQHNILLGKDDAPEGERGVLIDFDRAFRLTNEQPEVMADHNIGTRIFQSLSVLKSVIHPTSAPAHDYLDELESFFYVLAYILLLYRPDGSLVPSTEKGPSIICGWGEELPSVAYGKKEAIYGAGRTAVRCSELIKTSWGPECGALFVKFRDWVYGKLDDKAYFIRMQARGTEINSLASLLSKRDEHYAIVLKMFDDAILEIETSQSTKTDSATFLPSAKMEIPVEDSQISVTAPVPSDRGILLRAIGPYCVETSAPTTPLPPEPPLVIEQVIPANRKRRSEAGEHPDSPDAKAGRKTVGTHTTTRSP